MAQTSRALPSINGIVDNTVLARSDLDIRKRPCYQLVVILEDKVLRTSLNRCYVCVLTEGGRGNEKDCLLSSLINLGTNYFIPKDQGEY